MALSTAWAQTPPAPAPAAAADPLADRMHRLTQDLRCLVCQNESLADSHAPLAMDLKREIRSLMAQGQSDAQIRDFLTQRYGDFVNYQPPLRAGTLLLWAGPLLLLAAGGWLVWRTVRASQRTQSHAPGQAGAPPQAASVGDGPSASPHLTEPSEQAPAEPGANTSATTGANTGANSGADTGAASHGGGDGGDGGGGGGGD
ncbi:MAG: cytochrome c-type biogenesis protein CcmH [Pseudomonadota bacterium]|nr:cytochrome c-type biogenesis protein CcmH [Pseudomonadota bacterium]